MKMMRRFFAATAVFFAAAVSVGSAVAAEYPTRTIRLICPYAAGGLTDILARMLAKRLSERLGQPVVVENRTGAGGILGVEAAAKAAPDGYTIALFSQGLASVNASLYKDLSYDTLKDFVPLSLVTTFSMVLVGNPDSRPATMADFVTMARANPGKLNYGSAGNASTSHLAMELLKDQLGIDVMHVPYKGESAAFSEVMGGRLSVMFTTLGGGKQLIESGKLRPLAIASSKRSPLIPEVPTIAETASPGFEVLGWYAILAPTGVPTPIADLLSKELMAIAKEPETIAWMTSRGMDAVGSSQADLASVIKSETERWGAVVKKTGIKPD